MGQAQPKRRTALIVEDDAELRSLTAALLEEEQLDTIECESAEAALAVLLIGGQDIAMIFADVRLPGAMDGIDLAWEVKLRWPLLPMVLTSGHPRERERLRELPPGVAFMPKPWQPFNVLVVAEEALARAPIASSGAAMLRRPSSSSLNIMMRCDFGLGRRCA
jgi:CheY-like chemotaxis protein